MDNFENDELYQIRSAFYTGNYQTVVDESVDNLTRSDEAQLYKYRARIEIGEAETVAAEMQEVGTTGAGFEVVRAFADYRSGKKEKAVADIEELIQADSDDDTVQVIGATVLFLEGRTDEALELLSKHENNLEAVALIIQIRIAQHNLEAAEKELNATKSWAQDSMLAQLAEAWVNLAKGGEGVQGAYYIYEELAQSASSTSKSLLGQAVAEIQLGRLPEAEATLRQALEKNPQDADVLANAIVCATLAGKDSSEYFSALKGKDHPLVRGLEEQSALFDSAAANYQPSVAA